MSIKTPSGTRILGGLAIAAGLILSGCGTSSAAIVATYNGGAVTQAQMDKQVNLVKLLNPTLKVTTTIDKQIVQNYILGKLFLTKAAKAGLKIPQTQLNQDLLNFKQSQVTSLFKGSTSAMDAQMQTLHLTNADFMPIVEEQLLAQAYMQRMVKTVPLSQQQQYYKTNYLSQFVKVTERAILVKSLPLAENLANQLRHGGSWKVLAKKYSQDPGSKNNGGEYVLQSPSQWVASFQHHAMTQPIGVVGNPFHSSQFGYFVMEVLQRQITPFSQAQSGILQQLEQQQAGNAFNAMLTQMQKSANIKITLK